MAGCCLFSYAQKMDTTCAPFNCCRPDGHAPLGVMTDHMHAKGQWIISYTYMDMMMSGNRSGTSKISDDEIFQNYYASPEKMNMQMNMLMVMYGLSDKLNLMGMFNIENSNSMSMNMDPTMQMHMADAGTMLPGSSTMAMTTAMANMTTKTIGIGDTKLYALYKLADRQNTRVIIGLGLSLPTGSITQKGMNVAGDTSRSSYNMQSGTGSLGILPSVTYIGQANSLSWGISAAANIITGANSEGYQWGNQYKGTAWLAYKWCKYISNSVRIEGINTGSIKGYDPAIEVYSYSDPTANTANYGGTTATVYLGLNFYVPKGQCKDVRILFEYGIPVYQNLNGMQLSMQSGLLGGIQYQF